VCPMPINQGAGCFLFQKIVMEYAHWGPLFG
jgi:hypothetical protein